MEVGVVLAGRASCCADADADSSRVFFQSNIFLVLSRPISYDIPMAFISSPPFCFHSRHSILSGRCCLFVLLVCWLLFVVGDLRFFRRSPLRLHLKTMWQWYYGRAETSSVDETSVRQISNTFRKISLAKSNYRRRGGLV